MGEGALRPSTTEENTTIRRPMRPEPTNKDGPRINDAIIARDVQLITEGGDNVGVISKRDALMRAEEAGLDLVEVAGNADPPVCKIMDYGKYKYQAQKKAAEARKKQKTVEVKEIKLRPNIDTHDYDVKVRAMKGFFEEGDKVKVTLRFRGREMAHQDLGMQLLVKVRQELDTLAKVEVEPKLEGKQMIMILAPR
jgi:translation initiation factor IF-3